MVGRMLNVPNQRALEIRRDEKTKREGGFSSWSFANGRRPLHHGEVRYDFEEEEEVMEVYHFSVMLPM